MGKASRVTISWARLLLAVALAVGLAGAGPALAGEPADRALAYEESPPASPDGTSASMLWASVRTAGSLALVLAVIGVGVAAVRGLGLRGRRVGQGSDGPRVVARTYLGPKESLCVVRVGPEVLLLGVSSQQISMLCKLDPARMTPSPPARTAGGGQEPGAFQRTLRQLAGEGEGGEIATAAPAFEGRLQRLRAAWGLGKE